MELRNFDLNLLVAFKYLIEEKSVSRAAEKLFISQSAMSHVLRRLRRELEDPVLVKTPSGMKPTQRAQALLDPIRAVLEEVEQIIRTPEEFSPATSQRRFVIATSDYIEFTLLPPLIEALSKRAPDVELHVKQITSKLLESGAIEENQIDLIIGFEAVLKPASHLCYEQLFTDSVTSVVRQDHPDIPGDTMSFERFMASRHMLISRRETGTGLIDDWLEKRGLTRKVSLVVPNFLSAPWIVANTDLVLSLPSRIAEQFVDLAPLKILPIPIDVPIHNLIMVWHPLREKEPAHEWLRRQIRETCAELRR